MMAVAVVFIVLTACFEASGWLCILFNYVLCRQHDHKVDEEFHASVTISMQEADKFRTHVPDSETIVFSSGKSHNLHILCVAIGVVSKAKV